MSTPAIVVTGEIGLTWIDEYELEWIDETDLEWDDT